LWPGKAIAAIAASRSDKAIAAIAASRSDKAIAAIAASRSDDAAGLNDPAKEERRRQAANGGDP
jgi:hypothetical protein